MKKGKPQKIKWKDYAHIFFQHPTPLHPDDGADCGAWALHAITKKPLKGIMKLSKNGHWSNATMFKYLRKNGFEVIPVTMGNMVEAHSVNSGRKPMLGKYHVMLIEQHCYKEENTWAVLHNNEISHSGELLPLDPLEMINYPLAAAYLIHHKNWRF
jgi:hypothetical protein